MSSMIYAEIFKKSNYKISLCLRQMPNVHAHNV